MWSDLSPRRRRLLGALGVLLAVATVAGAVMLVIVLGPDDAEPDPGAAGPGTTRIEDTAGSPSSTTVPGTTTTPSDLCLAADDLAQAGTDLTTLQDSVAGPNMVPYLSIVEAALRRVGESAQGAVRFTALRLADEARAVSGQVAGAPTPEESIRIYREAVDRFATEVKILFDLLEITCPSFTSPIVG